MAHKVTGPLAVVQLTGGPLVYLYRDAPVPDDAVNLDHLVSMGLVSDVDEPSLDDDGNMPAEKKPAAKKAAAS